MRRSHSDVGRTWMAARFGEGLFAQLFDPRGREMGLSRWTRALIALAVILPAFAASTATAATLSSDEPVPLGSRAIEPVIDRNTPGMIEAFDFVAKSDGPV